MDQKQNIDSTATRQQVIDAIKKANNVLITVSQNPSVDQLSSCIGLALMLNKLDKHATAIFSGDVPSTIEFLKPEELLETNTDSLRDFIISLDRAKADKLRYKVEDNIVRIFITPYRTALSQGDLVYSQGDFNVDLVLALGVDQREHLDLAIIQQGRILHDAVVIGVSSGAVQSNVGAINWHEPTASSISELIAGISDALQPGLLDEQISTALLTGVVAETDRFRNEKTTAMAMSISALLMSNGANQLLVAKELDVHEIEDVSQEVESEIPVVEGETLSVQKDEPGSLAETIVTLHKDNESQKENVQLPGEDSGDAIKNINIDEAGIIHEESIEDTDQINKSPHKIIQPLSEEKTEYTPSYTFTPPSRGGTLTAVDQMDPAMELPNPINQMPPPMQILNRESPLDNTISSEVEESVPQITQPAPTSEDNLSQLTQPESPITTEESVRTDNAVVQEPVPEQNITTDTPEETPNPESSMGVVADNINQETARKAVLEAVSFGEGSPIPEPIVSLNAQPMDLSASAPSPNQSTQLPPPPLPPPITPMPESGVYEPSASNPVISDNTSPNMVPQGNTPFNLPPP